MYNLKNRDETAELKARYNAMVNTLSDILGCGIWDIEELFDSDNNIEVGEIVKNYISETGVLPNWNMIYREAMFNFASEHDLKIGEDVDIYPNFCLNTSIYAREDLDPYIIEEMENLFNMNVNTLNF